MVKKYNPSEVGALLSYTSTCCIYISLLLSHLVSCSLLGSLKGTDALSSRRNSHGQQCHFPNWLLPSVFWPNPLTRPDPGSPHVHVLRNPLTERCFPPKQTVLCQAPPWQASYRKQTVWANGALHKSICCTYAMCTLGSRAPLDHLTEGKGQLPVIPMLHTWEKFLSNAFALQCCTSLHPPRWQAQQPSPRISFPFASSQQSHQTGAYYPA